MKHALRVIGESAVATLQGLLGESTSSKARAFLEAVVSEERAAVEERRKALHAQRAEQTAALTALVNAHAPRAAAAQATIERANQALQEAVKAGHRLHAEHRVAVLDAEYRIGRIEGALRDTASPRIAAFRKELRAMVPAASAERDSVLEQNIAGRTVTLWSNHESVDRHIEAIFETLRSIDHLELEPLDDVALELRFTELLEYLPTIDQRPAKYGGLREQVDAYA